MSRKMKDSGIEWIGEIPEDWDVVKLKYIAEAKTGNSIKDDEKELYGDNEEAIPYISTKDIDVDTNKIDYENGMYIKKNDSSFRVAKKNSILLCIEGGSAGRKIAFTDKDISHINKLCNFDSFKSINKFLYYYMQSPSFLEEFRLNMSGLIGGVSVSSLKQFEIPNPKLESQQKIAIFLDKKVAEIDHILDKTRESIDEYKKYKQSIITEAVTKGLNKDASMKDSGIEWIGEIPEHWKVTTISKVFSYIGGYAYKSERFIKESTNQVIRLGNVKNDNLIIEDKQVFIDDSDAIDSAKCQIMEDDILFTMTGTKGKRDYMFTLLVDEHDLSGNKLFINQRVGCFRKKNQFVHMAYYNYLLKNERILDSIFIYESGTANQGNLGIENIKKTKMHFPPFEEQVRIANYINSKLEEMNKLVRAKEDLLIELEKYKKSLIYECVTGKREVI